MNVINDNFPYPLTSDFTAMFDLVMQGKRLVAFVTENTHSYDIVKFCEVRKTIYTDSIEFFTLGMCLDSATVRDGRTLEQDFYRACKSLNIQFIQPFQQ